MAILFTVWPYWPHFILLSFLKLFLIKSFPCFFLACSTRCQFDDFGLRLFICRHSARSMVCSLFHIPLFITPLVSLLHKIPFIVIVLYTETVTTLTTGLTVRLCVGIACLQLWTLWKLFLLMEQKINKIINQIVSEISVTPIFISCLKNSRIKAISHLQVFWPWKRNLLFTTIWKKRSSSSSF